MLWDGSTGTWLIRQALAPCAGRRNVSNVAAFVALYLGAVAACMSYLLAVPTIRPLRHGSGVLYLVM